MAKSHKQIFSDAVKLVSDPAHWTQSSWARNKDGTPIAEYGVGNSFDHANHKEACQWCIEGAIMKSAPSEAVAMRVIDAYDANVTFNDKFGISQHTKFINECERKLKS